MFLFYAIFFTVLGLMIGSFLNVCIYRIPNEESIVSPGSHCPKCNKPLESIDLVPVFSWLFLKGKCRTCKVKIPARYTLVELLTGALFLVSFISMGLTPTLIAALFFESILIAITFIDIDHLIIPNGLVITGIIGGLLVVGGSAIFKLHFFIEQTWLDHLLGILPGVIAMLLIMILGALIYKQEALGMGDVKLFIPIGLILGWKLSIVVVLVAILLGGIGGIIILLFTKADRKTEMPFGPYIAASAIIVMIMSQNIMSIVNWYFNLL